MRKNYLNHLILIVMVFMGGSMVAVLMAAIAMHYTKNAYVVAMVSGPVALICILASLRSIDEISNTR